MLANTITLTVGGVAKVLTRINAADAYSSEYLLRETLGSYRMKIRNSESTKAGVVRDRHNIEVVHTVYATSTVLELVRKVYLVFEQDKSDLMTDEVKALCDQLVASTAALIVSLGNWES